MKTLAYTLGAVMFVMILGYAGKGDAEIAAANHKTYCGQIKSGAWPAYNGKAGCK